MMKTSSYQFRYISSFDDACPSEFPVQSDVSGSYTFEEATPWPAVLQQFLNFLSGIYGYDISEQVQFETLEEKLDRLREKGVILDDPEPWDDEYFEPCERCGK